MPIVEVSNLTKSYTSGVFRKSSIQALSGVSLSVNEGEIFGLLGPNGAGKTTFVKILLSIVFPSSGTATVLNHKLGSIEIRKKVGYLPENHRYPSFLTAIDTMKHFGRLSGIPSRTLAARIPTLLQLVGLADWHKVKIRKFSKGMLQRLGLAVAMVNDPHILFLDEPTDGVDPIGRKEIRDILKSLRSQGKTIFLNSHMLSEVEEISDRVAILNKGHLLHVGTIADITSHQLEYEIRFLSPPPPATLHQLRSFCKSVQQDQTLLHVAVNDRQDFQKVLDILRQEGIEIESFSPRKSRLEDYFMRVISTGAE
ncbi:MAG: ABC transporter ATP-binding protein [Bacteroidota bacterium]